MRYTTTNSNQRNNRINHNGKMKYLSHQGINYDNNNNNHDDGGELISFRKDNKYNKNMITICPTQKEGCIGSGIVAFSTRTEQKNKEIVEIYMIRNNKNHTLFLPHETRNKNEGEDLIATAVSIWNKYTHHVFEKDVEKNIYYEIVQMIRDHKACSPKCCFVKDKHHQIFYFTVPLKKVSQCEEGGKDDP